MFLPGQCMKSCTYDIRLPGDESLELLQVLPPGFRVLTLIEPVRASHARNLFGGARAQGAGQKDEFAPFASVPDSGRRRG